MYNVPFYHTACVHRISLKLYIVYGQMVNAITFQSCFCADSRGSNPPLRSPERRWHRR